MKFCCISFALITFTAGALAQSPQPLGSVASSDAWVSTAGSAVIPASSAGRSAVNTGATVTARPGRNAELALTRGGAVLVCQSTGLHVTASNDALLLALDRGAVEIRMKARASDVLMTPDLRFTPGSAGPLDLRMRVTFNGDTCVENRGHKAPAFNISDAFGETSYLLKPGQHVLFQRGSLKAVTDRETTPCGCPPNVPEPPGMSVAEAVLRGGQNKPLTAEQSAALHPFPAAVSDGLAEPAPGAPEAVGQRHVEVSSTLRFDPAATAPATPPPAQPPPPPVRHRRRMSSVGRFFKHIFVR